MEYFDVTNIPQGFLRASFKTASEQQTGKLIQAFAPVVEVLLTKASKEQKLRIGFLGDVKTAKSFSAAELLKALITMVLERAFILEKVSRHIMDQDDNWYSHYDAHAIDSSKIRAESSEEIALECESHDDHKNAACAHFIEWPEYDDDPNLNALWAFYSENNFLHRLKASDRHINLYVTDEIAAMPEYQQFLLDTTEFRID